MSEKKRRKSYAPAFKAKIGLEALKGEKTINEIGQEHGVHPAQVGQWKRAIQEQAQSLFEGKKRGPVTQEARPKGRRRQSRGASHPGLGAREPAAADETRPRRANHRGPKKAVRSAGLANGRGSIAMSTALELAPRELDQGGKVLT